MSVYILKCSNDKYYVGYTEKDINYRFNEHLNGFGSSWTKKYKPIEVLKHYNVNDRFEEDKQTKMLMSKYGIENVRGGSYVSIILPSYQILALRKEILSGDNKCYICKNSGHYARDCNSNLINENFSNDKNLTDVSSNDEEYDVSSIDEEYDDEYVDEITDEELTDEELVTATKKDDRDMDMNNGHNNTIELSFESDDDDYSFESDNDDDYICEKCKKYDHNTKDCPNYKSETKNSNNKIVENNKTENNKIESEKDSGIFLNVSEFVKKYLKK
jgi:hypothetical protein